MKFKPDRYVRFKEPNLEKSFRRDRQSPSENGFHDQVRFKSSVDTKMESIRRGIRNGYEGIRGFKRSSMVHPSIDSNKPTTKEPSCTKKNILDPQGPFLQSWNKIFVLACVLAVSLDPLFFYIPVVDGSKKCFDVDKKMEITACVLRSFTDLFYIIHIVLQFRTGFIAPFSRVFGKGELIEDPYAIAKRYLSSYFIVDILSILPVPQVTILLVIPALRGQPVSLITKDILKFVIIIQYVPRFFRIFPLYREVTRTSGIFTETAWAGAAFNLFLYMLASHIFGSFWYLIAIERKDRCWRDACKRNNPCNYDYLYCGEDRLGDYGFLNTSCPLIEQTNIQNSTDFDFGIFLDALQSGVVETRNFPKKLLYCFWWGLRNLSSLGQNLKTSTYVGEILFAVFIAIVGLVLFSLLIGNMQKYLQSITVRVEEMRIKRRDAELWMSHRLLPDHLRARIRRHEQYKWQETRGVDEESLIHNLPKDLKRDIKHHLCWSLVTRVPMFENMDDQLLDAMCDHLKPVLYTEKSFIVREGDPVDEMLFIMRGDLLTITTNGGRTGFFNSVYLKAGDFCGEELLTWALESNFSSSLPTSTRTVQALVDVEAFALVADDLKFVASQFRRLHSKQLQHIFRFYSQQWRTWGACFIQAAWRTHCRRKHEKALRAEEDKLQAALAKESGTSPSLGATIYASRFAANMLKALRGNHSPSTKLPLKVPPLMLQKPAEPDFSAADLR